MTKGVTGGTGWQSGEIERIMSVGIIDAVERIGFAFLTFRRSATRAGLRCRIVQGATGWNSLLNGTKPVRHPKGCDWPGRRHSKTTRASYVLLAVPFPVSPVLSVPPLPLRADDPDLRPQKRTRSLGCSDRLRWQL